MSFWKPLLVLFSLLSSAALAEAPADAEAPSLAPLVRVVDLSEGESAQVALADGATAAVRLIAVRETRDPIRDAVRQARVTVEVNGERAELVAGNYRLPIAVGGAQIDCTVTRGCNTNGDPAFWGLDKDARLRLWPAQSPWIRPDTFRYPARQRWFASSTQMSNEPTYVDGGEPAARKRIYYHSGLDIGGSEGQVEVVAATEGLVVSSGNEMLDAYKADSPVRPRYDVVYLRDARGWFYRYSHLKTIDPAIVPGRVLSLGQPIGLLGKEGGSGGWSHLHFEIKSRQPSGKWGTQDGYAFLWQAYQREHKPEVIAVARPHHLIRSGDSVELDGSRSFSAAGAIAEHRWTFTDGSTAAGPRVVRRYDQPGMFSEILEVRDRRGRLGYDFAIVQVHDSEHPDRTPPTIHAAYAPTLGIKPGDPVTFKVRSFGASDGEVWDFGDGSPPVTVKSDGNAKVHAPDGYAATEHRFARPGHYVVRVQLAKGAAYPAITHLHVVVEEPDAD